MTLHPVYGWARSDDLACGCEPDVPLTVWASSSVTLVECSRCGAVWFPLWDAEIRIGVVE